MRRTRAYRRHHRARIKARHLRDYSSLTHAGIEPPKDIATRHPLDCGRRCWLCHYGKLAGLRPRREAEDWRQYDDSPGRHSCP